MDLNYALILAFAQGILEWFPVSSSGHLILIERLFHLRSDLSFEVALHFGTLMAVFVYFRKDIVNIIRDMLHQEWGSPNARLGLYLLAASIPAGLLGFFFKSYFEYSSLLLMGFGWTITSLALFIGSFSKIKIRDGSLLGFPKSLLIGFSQALALLPGVSRSGITISSGLFLGMKENDAIKFSYLLSIPVIFGASIVTFGNRTIPLEFLFPMMVCFGIGLFFMNFSFKFILNKRKNLRWFAIYTLILGLTCLILSFN